jgi:hypothetical protein
MAPGFTPMVNRCVNPACREEFKLLNAGDLYAHESRSSSTEFFWLCATCAGSFDLYLEPAGGVSVRSQNATNRIQPPNPESHLRLVSRSKKPVPRPRTVPSGERAFSFVFDADLYSYPFRTRGGIDR